MGFKMFINKWLVSDSLNSPARKDWKGGFCLDLCDEPAEIQMSDLYKDLQRLPVEHPFAILFSGKNSLAQKVNDSYIENIISLFFQPSYFLANDRPVVFLSDKAAWHTGFIEKLSEKCRNQGLSVLLLRTKDGKSIDRPGDQFAYEVTSADISYDAIIENWLSQYLEDKNPREIHFLFGAGEPGLTEILDEIRKKEMELHNTEHYKFANLAYKKQKLIEKYKKELDVKVSAEKSTQLYLSMQKKQTADNVEWYHHEYEILPTWYKRLGHVIKVLMGRRTFRSLFSDKAKKYKD
jgi:hypothetical protein